MMTLMQRTKDGVLVETHIRIRHNGVPKRSFYQRNWQWLDWWLICIGLAVFAGAAWALEVVR